MISVPTQAPRTPLCAQRRLPIRLDQRTVLVTVDTARAALGVDAETIYASIDDGSTRWAWDVASAECRVQTGESGQLPSAISHQPSAIREVRLWARELIAPATVRGFTADQVVDMVIGTERERLRGVEVALLLLCSRPHIERLVRSGFLQGPVIGHTRHITRASLRHFLMIRLIS